MPLGPSRTSPVNADRLGRCSIGMDAVKLDAPPPQRYLDCGRGGLSIMLTERELEPAFVYERAAKEFDIPETAAGFEDMVTETVRVFFEERRRAPDAEPARAEADEASQATALVLAFLRGY